MSIIKKLKVLIPSVLISFAAHSTSYIDFDNVPSIDPDLPSIRYVTFPTLTSTAMQGVIDTTAKTERGVFRVPPIPAGQTTIPAVVFLHGTSGPDSIGPFYTDALNDAGIATLEIDMYATRGLTPSVGSRPTNPMSVMEDVYGALVFLANQPGIDPNRIGLMGVSAGGVLTVISATGGPASLFADSLVNPQTQTKGSLNFAAYAAQYPVCYLFLAAPLGPITNLAAPLMIQTGGLDSYNPPSACQALGNNLPTGQKNWLSVNVYPDASHGWDRLQPAITVQDPYALSTSKGGPDPFGNPQGNVTLSPNIPAAALSRYRIVNFFANQFGVAPQH